MRNVILALVGADGSGEVREPRLYRLIRQGTGVDDRTFEIGAYLVWG